MAGRVTALFGCALLMAVALTWVFLGQRAVMDVGGTCASGGPYAVATPCPDHVPGLIGLGIALLLVGAFAGTAAAGTVGAPDLLLPMWWLLFGSLGWNFLAYGLVAGDLVWGWVLSGLLSLGMALPALWLQLPWSRDAPARLNPSAERPGGWLAAYGVLGLAGAALGWTAFVAWT